MRRTCLVFALTLASLLAGSGAAQAVVIDTSAIGKSSVAYNPNGQESYIGVRVVPDDLADGAFQAAKVPSVVSNAPCSDPALTTDLGGPVLPNGALCSHGGAVMHNNETFTFVWDPVRSYFATTKNYVEQFLRDVADSKGTFTSPFSEVTQYTDSAGRAANDSLYGGACTDFGNTGGATCQFGNSKGTGPGYNYPSNGCAVSGTNHRAGPNLDLGANTICLTDPQLRSELATMISQTGVTSHTKPGYGPLLILTTPPGVEVCTDSSGKLCSANSDHYYIDPPGSNTGPCKLLGGTGNSPCSVPTVQARFCSYHSQVLVNGTEYPYVVQPWTAETTTTSSSQGPDFDHQIGCDEPDDTAIPNPVDLQKLAIYLGQRLVSPLSQGMMSSIVNPNLNGWFALDGSEISDNGCEPFPNQLDSATLGTSGQNPYFLQREFNNAGVIETDPNALGCIGWTRLDPTFVIPSAVNPGDVVALDGTTSVSSLIVPRANYFWDFGDGTTAVGPTVEHSYSKGGTYSIKLTVIDRGGNVAHLSQTILVNGANGQPVNPTPPGGGSKSLQVRLQLVPQGLKSVLKLGIAMRVTSNQAANGIVTLSISRSAAKKAHIRTGRGPNVVIARGTVSKIKNGTVNLRLRFSRSTIAKLRHLRHVTVTIRLALYAAGGVHKAYVVAGRY